METTKLIIIIFIFSIFNTTVKAQVEETDRKPCGASQVNNNALQQNPSLKLLEEERDRFALEYKSSKNKTTNKKSIAFTIPVVYHIIHDGPTAYVTKSEVEASLQNLNEDFQALNSDLNTTISEFLNITADCQVEFRLAHKDPNGNCTEGITYTESPLTLSAGENVKSLINWNQASGTQMYIQIWVVSSLTSGAGGYSYYPGTTSNMSEGIIIRSAQLGNSVTHEMGHYLNLRHCWGNSNNPGLSTNCNEDDGVSDTPETIGNQSCNLAATTCGSLDNVQNYMDYSFCETMFTNGQKIRLHAALSSSIGSRNNLSTSANAIATGISAPYDIVVCTPNADFTYNKSYICEGDSVSYTDLSWGSEATAWNWTFTGGTPSTGNIATPSITYNTAGTYSTTLVASNSAAGSGTKTLSNIITVSSLTADYAGPTVEEFENTTQFNNQWRVESDGGQAWTNTNAAAFSGSRSVRLRNFFTTNYREVDDLISPSYDLSATNNPTLTFKVAYKKKNSDSNDRLFVYYSTDCGNTWQLHALFNPSSISTSPDQSSEFTPTTTSQWLEKSVNILSISSETNVRFKFSFRADGGNNIFIDDININGTVGISEMQRIGNFNVFPNPTSSSAKISFNLVTPVKKLTINVKNSIGQEVTRVINGQAFNTGKYTLQIDERKQLSKGIYFIEFNADGVMQVQKLIVQ